MDDIYDVIVLGTGLKVCTGQISDCMGSRLEMRSDEEADSSESETGLSTPASQPSVRIAQFTIRCYHACSCRTHQTSAYFTVPLPPANSG